jgi:glycosyltransferase involved in cell wall biosynthesis
MGKRLVIDARMLRTGIGRYVMNLLEGLQQHTGFSTHALVRKQDADTIRPLCDDITIVDLPIYSWREQMSVSWAARRADLLHVPHYNVPVLFRGEFLVTIHDLIHLTDPTVSQTFGAKAYARPMLSFAVHKARRIVTVSNFSKLQIMRQLKIEEEQITVIYNGVHPRFRNLDREDARRRVSTETSLRPPYFLYVGNLKLHKNLEVLLRAFGLLRARGLGGYRLVILGDGARQKATLQRACARLGISDHVCFVAQVGEEILPFVYAAADLFVMPSLLEGFGYPVVEAMACGTPVVCSRASSLPEIAGDAVQFFDPTSCEDLAGAIEHVLQSSDYREMLRLRGLARARVFAWEECGRSHAKLYREMLEV